MSKREIVMLANRAALEEIPFPCMVSPKIDGIRVFRRGTDLLTRNGTPLRNEHARRLCEQSLPEGLDGELTLADVRGPMRLVGGFASAPKAVAPFRFNCFDYLPPRGVAKPGRPGRKMAFHARLEAADAVVSMLREHRGVDWVVMVPHYLVECIEDLRFRYEQAIGSGFEGIMCRDPYGRYEMGRPRNSRFFDLVKVKAFEDEEATVTGMEEEMANESPPDMDGQRGSVRELKRGKDSLGKIHCRFDDGTEFRCGSGFTKEERRLYWTDRSLIVGKRVTIKHQPSPGGRKPGEKPRFPVFKCVREDA